MERLATLRVISRADAHGRRAMAGRHTNYGYSGNVLIQVTDGSFWYRLEDGFLAHQLGLPKLEYEYAYEREGLISNAKNALKQFGARVAYVDNYGVITLRMKNEDWVFRGYKESRTLFAKVERREDQPASNNKLEALLMKFNSR